MATLILPYTLQDGHKAYAGKLMANLQALADKLNGVNIPGLGLKDVEAVLQELKLRLDAAAVAEAKEVTDFSYDQDSGLLRLTLANGAVFTLDMRGFVSDYSGLEGHQISVSVDAERRISAELAPGAVQPAHLAAEVLALTAAKITADQSGNAAQIRFNDGETMQDKLDGGRLQGPAGVSLAADGMYYLRYDPQDGHLYVGVAQDGEQPPLSINAQGHLLYEIA